MELCHSAARGFLLRVVLAHRDALPPTLRPLKPREAVKYFIENHKEDFVSHDLSPLVAAL